MIFLSKKTKPILLAFMFGLSLMISSCSSNKDVDKPNVVLIFVDDMGYGDLGCYGNPLIETPNIDQMADEGIRLTSFYAAASVCTPSRASLLTGRYPIRNLPNNIMPKSQHGLPTSEVTIANILKEGNYKTAAIGKWHLGHQKEYLPTSRGFDSFYGLPYSNDMILPWCPWLTENDKLLLYENSNTIKEVGYDQDKLTIDYTNKAIEFIKNQKDSPFLLYLAHSMPHLPVSAPEQFKGNSKRGLYGDVIQTLDWSVGRILSTLKELNIDERTFVIFLSDNGPWNNLPERMLQKGVKPWHGGSAGPLRGSKATTYEGGFRVPAIFRWPGTIPEGQINREIATAMDVFSTIVHVTGTSLPENKEIDGNNIFPLLQGKKTSPTGSFHYLNGEKVEAVRAGKWKLRNTLKDGVELYNLEIDPGENYNVAESNIELVNELYQQMVGFSEDTKAKIDSLYF